MYKLIIVDDEAVVRNSLKKKIKWDELSIALAGEANDGIEALELFEEAKPNIILMDIDIPYINGLDVSKSILEMDKDAKVIIITGHNNFEYAQKALKIGAFDLLLKPMDRDDLNNTLGKVCDSLDNIRQEKIKSEKLEKMMSENIPILRDKFISSLLFANANMSTSDIEDKLDYLNINIVSEQYNIAVAVPNMQNTDNSDMVFMAVKNIIEEIMEENKINKFVYMDNLNRLIIIFGYRYKDARDTFDNIFVSINNKMEFFLKINMYLGIGKETSSLQKLGDSYSSACEALKYINTFSRNNVVNIKNINEIEKSVSIYSIKDIDNLVTYFKTGNMESFNYELNTLINRIITSSYGNMEFVKSLFVELTATLLRICSEMDVCTEHLLGNGGLYNKILSYTLVSDLKDSMIKIYCGLMNTIVDKRNTRVNKVIELAKTFIKDNHKNNGLDLKLVSEHIGLSSVYFCQQFFQETRMHFTEYLNYVRIEQAKKYLEESVLKIYEVAYSVGYKDPKHFNVIFKRLTGKTPNEFRKSF